MLQAANLTPDLEKLVETNASLVYGNMKEKIQNVLIDSCFKDSGVVPVKKEEYYFTNWKVYHKKGASKKREKPSGLSGCSWNRKVSGSNLTRHLAGLRDPHYETPGDLQVIFTQTQWLKSG